MLLLHSFYKNNKGQKAIEYVRAIVLLLLLCS